MMRILRVITAVTIGALLAAPARPAAQAKADVALRAAMETETVKGDLKAAIEQYKKVATSSDRAIAARALLRLAECYQKLGDAEAQRVYERLVREFADQKDAAATARARMGPARATGTGIGMVARQLWTTTNYSQVAIASDGRLAAVADGNSGDVQIRDLATGQITRLKVNSDTASGGYAEWPVLSPDQTHVAYAYAGPDTKWDYQVRVAPARPDAPARPIGRGYPYMYLNAWAPDGKSVLVSNFGENDTTHIAWLSTTDGSSKVLKSLTWQLGRPALSPDGKFIAYDVRREPGTAQSEIRILASDGSSENIVAPAPGENESPIWTPDGSRLLFKSDRSGTSGIWSIAIRNGQGDGAPTRIKADVGDIELIGFRATSLLYNHRSGTTDIYAVDLDSEAGTIRGDAARIVDTYLGSNINPAASPDRKFVAYHRRTAAANQWSHLVIRSLETGAERVIPTVFRYAGSPMWLPDGLGIIQQARNNQNNTALYKVDVKSGEVVTIVAAESRGPGAALSPDGRTAYASSKNGDRAVLNTFDLASGTHKEISHTGNTRGVATSPDGRSIAFMTTDDASPPHLDVFVADADGRNIRTILSTGKPNEAPARGVIRWSADSRFIYFLKGPTGSLWRVPAAGGAPSPVGELGKIPARTLDLTRDGRQVIFGTDSGFTVEVWALENVLQPARPPTP